VSSLLKSSSDEAIRVLKISRIELIKINNRNDGLKKLISM